MLQSAVITDDEFTAILEVFDDFAAEAQQCIIECLRQAIKNRAPEMGAAAVTPDNLS